MEEEYPEHSLVLFHSQLALNLFRVALATDRIRSYVIRTADGIPTALPASYWNTFAANSVLWDDRLVEFVSGDKRLCGHAIISASEFEQYLNLGTSSAGAFGF